MDGTVWGLVLYGVETTELSPAWNPEYRSAELSLTLVLFVLFQRLKDALGEVVAEMQNMDTADEG
jgi:hypothetical protein